LVKELSLAQTALAIAAEPSRPEATTTLLSSAVPAREPSSPAAPAREPSSPAQDAPARDSEVDRWFQSLRPPTPGGFLSLSPGAATEPPPALSPEARERLDQRRKLARKILVGTMAGSLCIVFAAVCVRAWAAVTAPRTASVAAVATQVGSPAPAAPDRAPAMASSTAAPTATTQVAGATPAPAPAPVARAASPIPRGMGELRLPPSATGHRLFVDNRPVGDASSRVRVACGRHVVRVGSAGRKLTINVPCGGAVDVTP
jgi:hypothetical protein